MPFIVELKPTITVTCEVRDPETKELQDFSWTMDRLPADEAQALNDDIRAGKKDMVEELKKMTHTLDGLMNPDNSPIEYSDSAMDSVLRIGEARAAMTALYLSVLGGTYYFEQMRKN